MLNEMVYYKPDWSETWNLSYDLILMKPAA